MMLGADARFVRASRSIASFEFSDSMGNWAGSSSVDSGLSPDERGSWNADGRHLHLRFDDGTTLSLRDYEVHPGDTLFFPQASQRIWKPC